jgi:hypothetical protein
MTYLDLPDHKRRETSRRAIARLQEQLLDINLSPEQSDKIRARLTHLQNWMAGTLSVELQGT